MSTISVILAHPFELSFNHGLAQEICRHLQKLGHVVLFHDLCAEGFDPVMQVQELGTDVSENTLVLQYQQELQKSDALIVIHPNWWGQPPAILKGWLDRVLRSGVAYKFGVKADGTKGMIGLLPIQKLLVFTTSNTPNEIEKEIWNDPLESIWIKYVAGFCCIPHAQRINFSVVVSSSVEQRLEWIQEALAACAKL